MADERLQEPGFVALVGAGPGAADLLTVRALRFLQQADVVLHDALVSAEVLAFCRPDARLLDVGKIGHGPSTPQDLTSQLLVEEALAGHRVVRLKGGDPFVFGRGGEECLALAAAGVAYELVPGISSALAAPLCAGIPVTHRGLATQVTVVTGSTAKEGPALEARWRHLAAAGGTLVFLMPIHTLRHIRDRLLEGGLTPDTPAALIESASLPSQRVVTGTLADITARAEEERIASPAVFVIGSVVALQEQISRGALSLSASTIEEDTYVRL
jgi:uroporphyrin-III C-methyltransferase